MHPANLFDKRSSRQSARGHRTRRLAVEGLEARQMLDVDPGTITLTESLGAIDLVRRDDLDVTAGDIWYSAEAGRDGFFSLEATDRRRLPQNATLTLHDSDGIELATSTETADSQRLDWDADQGDTFLIQVSGTSNDVDLTLANLVNHVGNTVTVSRLGGQR